MDMSQFLPVSGEKPLDRIVTDGGYCGIFRTIACVGDSLSSGEFESTREDGTKAYHDIYDYSWGQYIARMAGCKVYNFSKGGMSAKAYCESFAGSQGFWDSDKAAQAYIIALGVNDLYGQNQEIGSMSDVCFEDYNKNGATYAGYYAKIIQRYKEIQPDAKFFLMTFPYDTRKDEEWRPKGDAQRKLMYEMAKCFSNTYVLDIREYAPVYDEEFRKNFYLGGHMTPTGYIFTAKMVVSYIDYIIRHNMQDFKQVGFIGTPYKNTIDI
ncbi:MAG: SGNH/GDSL hydrolase family protein [Ruminococcaceae bacterium]|nr:SGNH/GDSL hydrolase family protein [Oscillospiraceae bacterium]